MMHLNLNLKLYFKVHLVNSEVHRNYETIKTLKENEFGQFH